MQALGYAHANHPMFKITGNFFNPGPYAGYIITFFPVFIACVFLMRKSAFYCRYTYLFILPVLTVIVLLILLNERAAWIAVVVAVIYFMVKEKMFGLIETKFIRKKHYIFFLAVIFFLLSGVLYFFKVDSSKGRQLVSVVAVSIFMRSPIFGCGYDNFKSEYMDAQAVYFKNNRDDTLGYYADDTKYAFNVLLQTTDELGLLGLCLIIILAIGLIKCEDMDDKFALLVKTGLLSILIFSFFSYPDQIIPIKINTIIYLAYLARYGKPFGDFFIARVPFSKVCFLLPFGLIILVSSIWAINNLNHQKKAFADWFIGNSIYQGGDFKGSLVYYEKARYCFVNYGEFIDEYSQVAAMVDTSSKQTSALLSRAKYTMNNTGIELAIGNYYFKNKCNSCAIDAYNIAQFMTPSRFMAPYQIFNVYKQSNNMQAAFSVAQYLMAKKIKVPSDAVSEIKNEATKFIDQMNNTYSKKNSVNSLLK